MSAGADMSASRGRHHNRADPPTAARCVAEWPARQLRMHEAQEALMKIPITRLTSLLDADRLTRRRGGSQGRAGAPASVPGRRAKRAYLASAGSGLLRRPTRHGGRGSAFSGAGAPRAIAELYVLAVLALLVGLLGVSAAATGVFH